MQLKEIGMEWRHPICIENVEQLMLKRGISYEEATRLDMLLSGQYRRARFLFMTNCVTSMVERLMTPASLGDFWKVMFALSSPEMLRTPFVSGGVLEVRFEADPFPILDMGDMQRKQATGRLIAQGIEVAASASCELAPVSCALDEARECDYENRWIWKRARSRWRYEAEVEVCHDTEGLRIYLNIYDPEGECIRRDLLVYQLPDAWSIRYNYLGKLKWESKTVVTLSSTAGNVFTIDLEKPHHTLSQKNRPTLQYGWELPLRCDSNAVEEGTQSG